MPKFESTNNPGLRFAAGRVGNPRGRPKSADALRRDVARELVRNGGALTRMAIERALKGDAACLAACLSMLNTVTAEKVAPAKPDTTDIARKGSTPAA
ncbi:hypothetical protein IST455A_01002 [Burkholderia multivorans]|uniref:DUF5681 domain-containing protein n=1 Tax=Burkholderia multivorans TaxID=87883 RepID=UPI00123B1411|nr:DUF5681 domain-containing protein [Burkholderia multivorans]MBU9247626.1 hypothetical protein [Burkholderia multivorans]QET31719.1 hypothetical protein FOB31_18900 [Burkholderia multivorans]QET40861.1 hypothetical protein FOB30_24960 [Burkholderia multivorans]CAB5280143.1 hypothetical protein IST495A_03481 [Burkholderia multivorans]CAB5300651.1 hypothetical protein IST419_01129 [Burkholderia multivorans]